MSEITRRLDRYVSNSVDDSERNSNEKIEMTILISNKSIHRSPDFTYSLTNITV